LVPGKSRSLYTHGWALQTTQIDDFPDFSHGKTVQANAEGVLAVRNATHIRHMALIDNVVRLY